MKTRRIIAATLLWLGLAAGAAGAETLTLAVGEWAPYTSKADSGARVAQVIVAESLKLAGIEASFAYVPWKRAYNKTLDGKYDATFPWYRTAERESVFVFPDTPLLRESYVFFHLKETPVQWESWEDLKRLKIGVQASDFTETLLKEKGLKVETLTDNAANFKKLMAGRIDIYPTALLVGYHTVQSLFGPEKAARLTHHPKPLKSDEMYIMFSKKAGPAMAERFARGFAILKASGRYDAIMRLAAPAP